MFKRLNSTLIIALCTSCAMIAFAFLQAHVTVTAATLDAGAAVICLLPVVFAPACRKASRKNASNAR